MKKNNKITPEGTKDLLFEECLTRRSLENTISTVFSGRGFQEVVTPGLEFYDVFDPDFSGIGQEIMYKMTDKRGRLVVMRPDSTLPIARLTATRLQGLPRPIRLFYTQPVYRSHPGLTGRSDETVQTGIELLGAAGFRADLEVLSTAVETLGKCAPGYRLELGHAGFFQALAEQLEVPVDVREDIRQAVGMKNYASLNQILDELGDSGAVRAMRELPRLFGGEEVFEKAAPYCSSERLKGMLDYLRLIYRSLSRMNPEVRLIVDLGLVQRNDYYTGVVFSAYVEELGDAVLLGGRYDHLLEQFGQPMPAIGFGVNVDALLKTVMERGTQCAVHPADVLAHGESGYEIQAMKYASRLAESGIRCETSVFSTAEEALRYAKETGIKRVDLISDEIQILQVEQDRE